MYAEDDTAQFIFVFDEWDFIFHQSFITENDKRDYLSFLRNLLKDKPYVCLAYMTTFIGICLSLGKGIRAHASGNACWRYKDYGRGSGTGT